MASDEKGKNVKETLAEEARSVLGEAYKDVGRPVLAPVGKTAGSAIEVLLAPVNFALDGVKAGFERLKARIGKKLERVPPERQIAAPATMAPAALHYALLGDGEEVSELRELFENLLVTSMDRATSKSVHPAFASIISQLTPDEAWILKSITQSEYAALHVQDFSEGEGNGIPRGLRTLLGRAVGIDELRIPQYISNLDRVGILRIDWGMSTTVDFKSYDKIEALVKAELPVEDPDRNLSLSAGVIFVTAFGAEFLRTCVRLPLPVPAARYG